MSLPPAPSMDAFNYLAVLISIILGLGITQLLGGIGRLLSARAKVRWFWPALLWAGSLLLIHIQAWWGMFGLRFHQGWTFGAFLIVLLLPIALYLAAALMLPDPGAVPVIEMEASYFANAGWSFAFSALVIVASFIRPFALGDTRHLDADTMAHGVFFVCTLVAARSRNVSYHKVLSVGFALALVAYALLLFNKLSA